LAVLTFDLLSRVCFRVAAGGTFLSALIVRLIRSRLGWPFFSGCLTIDLDFPGILLLLFATVLEVRTLGLLSLLSTPLLVTDGFLLPIELPMREVLSELMRLFELTAAGFLVPELFLVNFLPPRGLPECLLALKFFWMDLEALKVVFGLWIVRWLRPVPLLWGMLDVTVLFELIWLGGFDVPGLGRGLVDRRVAVALGGALPPFEGRRALGAAEAFLTCLLF